MAKFSVSVTVQLEIAATIEVSAKDADKAEEKVQQLIDDGVLSVGGWTPDKRSEKLSVEWEENGQEVEIENVEDAD